jgi:hypothetical protein
MADLRARLWQLQLSGLRASRLAVYDGLLHSHGALMRVPLMFLLTLALPSAAFASTARTQCSAGETVVFSCSTGTTRILSLCASQDVGKDTGYLQYRFGTADKLELVYPEKPQPPKALFTPGTLSFSGGGGTYLQFKKGAYTYTVFSAIGNFAPSGGKATAVGVSVKNGDKEVANIPCRKDSSLNEGELGPEFFEKAGLGDPESDFDIPDAFMPK